jgi:hypothetical protein
VVVCRVGGRAASCCAELSARRASCRPVLVVPAGVALTQRPCQNLLDRFELDLGQMRRVRPSDPDDLDRAGQPAASRWRRMFFPGYRDTPPTPRRTRHGGGAVAMTATNAIMGPVGRRHPVDERSTLPRSQAASSRRSRLSGPPPVWGWGGLRVGKARYWTLGLMWRKTVQGRLSRCREWDVIASTPSVALVRQGVIEA